MNVRELRHKLFLVEDQEMTVLTINDIGQIDGVAEVECFDGKVFLY